MVGALAQLLLWCDSSRKRILELACGVGFWSMRIVPTALRRDRVRSKRGDSTWSDGDPARILGVVPSSISLMLCQHVMRRRDGQPTRATGGARCGNSARRVLRGGTGTRGRTSRPVSTHQEETFKNTFRHYSHVPAWSLLDYSNFQEISIIYDTKFARARADRCMLPGDPNPRWTLRTKASASPWPQYTLTGTAHRVRMSVSSRALTRFAVWIRCSQGVCLNFKRLITVPIPAPQLSIPLMSSHDLVGARETEWSLKDIVYS